MLNFLKSDTPFVRIWRFEVFIYSRKNSDVRPSDGTIPPVRRCDAPPPQAYTEGDGVIKNVKFYPALSRFRKKNDLYMQKSPKYALVKHKYKTT